MIDGDPTAIREWDYLRGKHSCCLCNPAFVSLHWMNFNPTTNGSGINSDDQFLVNEDYDAHRSTESIRAAFPEIPYQGIFSVPKRIESLFPELPEESHVSADGGDIVGSATTSMLGREKSLMPVMKARSSRPENSPL